MNKLSIKIQELCSRKFVNKKIVERFLINIDVYDMRQPQAERCLEIDSKLYKWDYHTIEAIRVGIDYIYTEIKK